MNFFEHQDRSRRTTHWLVVLYVLTVAAIMAAVYFAAAWCWYFARLTEVESSFVSQPEFRLWDPDLFWTVTASVAAVILFGTIYKWIQLSQGGRVVAEMLGGRLIPVNTDDPEEKQLLNVVEEMAIASGTAVPPVYLLNHENGINAFAAGFSTRDAVIGVTRGCLKTLTRDQLQGVIAHEFSHILNGDMGLSLRLIGILHGILLLALTGESILRLSGRSSASSSSRSSRNKGSASLVMVFAGLSLLLIGWIGVFFGRVIKSAVSRQRESLADASAVQFTRYPEGLAGALKKIGGFAFGSQLAHPKAEQASHLYFSEGIHFRFLAGLFATHPPLEERIKKLDPQFNGVFPKVDYQVQPESLLKQLKKPASAKPPEPEAVLAGLSAREFVAQAGLIQEANLAYAASLLDEIPELLKENARDPVGARAVIFALLLDCNDPAVKETQLQQISHHDNFLVYLRLKQIADEVEKTNVSLRLPLIDLSLAALASLSLKQYETFRQTTEQVIMADGKIHYFELALKLVLFHHLDSRFGIVKAEEKKAADDKTLEAAGIDILSLMAHVGHKDQARAGAAFRAALPMWKTGLERAIADLEALDAVRIEQALNFLKPVSFKRKEQLLTACLEVVCYDRQVLTEEIEMIRAVADTLDSPLPPVAAGKVVAK